MSDIMVKPEDVKVGSTPPQSIDVATPETEEQSLLQSIAQQLKGIYTLLSKKVVTAKANSTGKSHRESVPSVQTEPTLGELSSPPPLMSAKNFIFTQKMFDADRKEMQEVAATVTQPSTVQEIHEDTTQQESPVEIITLASLTPKKEDKPRICTDVRFTSSPSQAEEAQEKKRKEGSIQNLPFGSGVLSAKPIEDVNEAAKLRVGDSLGNATLGTGWAAGKELLAGAEELKEGAKVIHESGSKSIGFLKSTYYTLSKPFKFGKGVGHSPKESVNQDTYTSETQTSPKITASSVKDNYGPIVVDMGTTETQKSEIGKPEFKLDQKSSVEALNSNSGLNDRQTNNETAIVSPQIDAKVLQESVEKKSELVYQALGQSKRSIKNIDPMTKEAVTTASNNSTAPIGAIKNQTEGNASVQVIQPKMPGPVNAGIDKRRSSRKAMEVDLNNKKDLQNEQTNSLSVKLHEQTGSIVDAIESNGGGGSGDSGPSLTDFLNPKKGTLGKLAAMLPSIAKVVKVGAAPLAGVISGFMKFMEVKDDDELNASQKTAQVGATVGGTLAGMASGAALGAFLGPIGIAVGGAVGGFIGSEGGQWLGNVASNLLADDPKEVSEQKRIKEKELTDKQALFKKSIITDEKIESVRKKNTEKESKTKINSLHADSVEPSTSLRQLIKTRKGKATKTEGFPEVPVTGKMARGAIDAATAPNKKVTNEPDISSSGMKAAKLKTKTIDLLKNSPMSLENTPPKKSIVNNSHKVKEGSIQKVSADSAFKPPKVRRITLEQVERAKERARESLTQSKAPDQTPQSKPLNELTGEQISKPIVDAINALGKKQSESAADAYNPDPIPTGFDDPLLNLVAQDAI